MTLRFKSKHRLLCGDSTAQADVSKLLAGEHAALCFTSPPYADQREYNGGKELSTKHLATFISVAASSVGIFAVNLGISRKANAVVRYWDDYIAEAESAGLKLVSWNVWDRGSPFSINQQTAMFPIEHEFIFVFAADASKLNLTVPNIHAGAVTGTTNREADGRMTTRRKKFIRDHRPLGTVIRTDVDRETDIDHPAKFPVSFAEEYVLACSAEGGLVFEPFGGSGSTLIACEKNARRCAIMELDPRYCDLILKRFEEYTKTQAVKSEGP